MTSIPMIPAKRMLRPLNAFTGLIKGQAALEPANGLVPGYSASGQDVWVPQEIARGHGAGIVLSAVGARCGKTFLTTAPQWGTVANTIAWSVSPAWNPKFVHYVLNREDFWVKGGSAQPYVQVEPSLVQSVANLSRNRQAEIVAFLDNETAQMDDLIAKQERLIELLAEKRQAVMTQAVTKGLDPNAHTKPSGIPWLGDVNEEWPLRPLKAAGEISLGKMIQPSPKYDSDFQAPYLRAANVQPDGVLTVEDVKEMWFNEREHSALDLLAGDVVVVEGGIGGFGRAAFVAKDLKGLGYQNSINRIRPHREVDGRFLTYLLLNARQAGFIHAYCTGVSMPHLTAEKLAVIRIPLPDRATQKAICDSLDNKLAAFDRLTSKASKVISIIRERRAALISAAVTGKINVQSIGNSQ